MGEHRRPAPVPDFAPPSVRRALPPEEHARQIKATVAALNALIRDAAQDGVCVVMEPVVGAMGDPMEQRLDVRVWRRL